MINSLGDGLAVIISCEYRRHYDWMSFASWYSFGKNLPDAEVFLACARPSSLNYRLFTWASRCHVPLIYYNGDFSLEAAAKVGADRTEKPLLVVDAAVMAVRQPSPGVVEYFNHTTSAVGPGFSYLGRGVTSLLEGVVPGDIGSDCSSDEISFLATCRDGCGGFVMSKWIDRKEYPFPFADRLVGGSLTANELQTIKLWKQMNPVFATLSGG